MRRRRLTRFGVLLVVVLLFSAVVVPTAAADGTIVHVVRSGETLYGIANRYGVNMYRLAEVNRLTNLNAIYVGQRLIIPTSGVPAPACPAYHRVARGENLTRIAARYGVTVWQVQQWNRITNPNRIYVGQVLTIYPPRCSPPAPRPTPLPPAAGWLAQYYNTRDLTGAPVLERREANLSYNWGYGSPAPAVFADNFSARWTRTFAMAGGTYRLTVRSDDGVQVYIDGVLVLDAWQVQAAKTHTVDVIIAGGNRTFTVQYFEAEGVAEISVNSTKL